MRLIDWISDVCSSDLNGKTADHLAALADEAGCQAAGVLDLGCRGNMAGKHDRAVNGRGDDLPVGQEVVQSALQARQAVVDRHRDVGDDIVVAVEGEEDRKSTRMNSIH